MRQKYDIWDGISSLILTGNSCERLDEGKRNPRQSFKKLVKTLLFLLSKLIDGYRNFKKAREKGIKEILLSNRLFSLIPYKHLLFSPLFKQIP